MPVKQDSINRELYGMLKSRGYRPDMFTSAGKKVAIPDEAEAFQFDFIKDGENYGKVTVTVDGLHRLIIYYGDDVENSPKADTHDGESFNSLRLHLKRFAKNKQLGFELSDIDDLEPDMAKREHNQKDKLAEGYYAIGKTKSYSDNVPSTKIVLQHSRQIEEGEQRYRNIAKIFVENSQGERFLVPTNKPGLARVYARHIAEGGTPYDERGQHITSICEEYSKMAGFVRATKNKQFNESVQRLISEGVNHYAKLRETLHKMAGKRGYNEYFENYTPALMEDEGVDLSEMFMQSSLDPRIENVMPILGKLSKNISETTEMVETLALENWADEIITHKGGKVTRKDGVTRHQSGPDQYGGSLPDEEEPDRLKKSQINKIDKELGVKFDREKKKAGGIKVDESNYDDEDDGLIAGRYTPEQWAKMIAVVKKKAQEQEAKKQQNQPITRVAKQNEGLDDFSDDLSDFNDPVADAKHEQEVRAQMQQQLKQGQGTSLKNMNPIDRDQYLKNTNRTWDPKTQRSTPATTAIQPQNEGLDSNQKEAGQLGPTEKITKNNPTRGKLVGANESVDPDLTHIKRLSGL